MSWFSKNKEKRRLRRKLEYLKQNPVAFLESQLDHPLPERRDIAIDNLLSQIPNHHKALYAKATDATHQNNSENALKYYQQIIRSTEDEIRQYEKKALGISNGMSLIPILLQAGSIAQKLDRGDLEFSYYLKIIYQYAPKSPTALWRIGRIYFEKGIHKQGVHYTLLAKDELEKQIEGFHKLGKDMFFEHSLPWWFRNMDDRSLNKIIELYEQTTEYIEDLIFVWTRLGDYEYQLKNYGDALSWYEKAINIPKEYIKPFLQLKKLYTRSKKHKAKMEKTIQSIKHLKHGDSYAWQRSGWIYYLSQDSEYAIQNYQKALVFNENDPLLLKSMAFAYIKNNQVNAAIEVLSKNIALNPNQSSTKIELMACYLLAKQKEKAFEVLQSLINKKSSISKDSIIKALNKIYKLNDQELPPDIIQDINETFFT